jgi:hypothetical protein
MRSRLRHLQNDVVLPEPNRGERSKAAPFLPRIGYLHFFLSPPKRR